MKSKYLFHFISILGFLFAFSFQLNAQDHIKITGKVIDAQTKEELLFAAVSFVGKEEIGTTTDFDGNYMLESRWGTDSLKASYVGYESLTKVVLPNLKKQEIIFELEPVSSTLTGVEVVAKKKRYKRKNNPAVALIKNVMANKDKNRKEGQDFYEYDKYEKVEYALNNLQEDFFTKNKVIKKFQFLEEYVDTSSLNGKPYLPIFIKETASKVYYRKNPKATKEYREGIKMTGLDDWIDASSLTALNDILYQEVDIYKNNIFIFKQSFLSPINDVVGNRFYRYYIIDTIDYKGMDVIEMAFMPANKQDLGFKGSLFILNDSSYAIVKAEISFTEQININWVNDIKMVQEFEKKDEYWIISKDQMVTDFALSGKRVGIYGTRTVMYDNQIFNQKRETSIYRGSEKLIEGKDENKRDTAFWNAARQEQLTESEENIYVMVDTLTNFRPFRRIMNTISVLTKGYINSKFLRVGPFSVVYSFNEVEGNKFRIGGKTSTNLFPKIEIEGNIGYGLRDKRWKYAFGTTYSFNENFLRNPRHFIKFTSFRDTKFVGQKFRFNEAGSIIGSFQRGTTSRMLMLNANKLNWFYELPNDLSFDVSIENQRQEPIGTLVLEFTDAENPTEIQSVDNITISRFNANIRWAPNEKYVQGENFRYPIFGRNPIFNVFYEQGVDGILGGQYNYYKLEFDAFKRIYLPPFGYMDAIFEVGKIWGDGLPYYMLLLPRANQTYLAKHRNFNLMNYLEFTNDFYVSWNAQHFFKGFIFNKVPLLRKLKLREIVSFKGIWGQLSDANNPDLNPQLIQFLKDEDGVPQTTSLESRPYMEVSAGVGNIFKVARVDFIKRLTYLDNPEVPNLFGVKGLGVRFVFGVTF